MYVDFPRLGHAACHLWSRGLSSLVTRLVIFGHAACHLWSRGLSSQFGHWSSLSHFQKKRITLLEASSYGCGYGCCYGYAVTAMRLQLCGYGYAVTARVATMRKSMVTIRLASMRLCIYTYFSYKDP